MMDFVERLASHVRLAILLSLLEEPAEERLRYAALRILSRIPGRAATASFLEEVLPDYGFDVTRDQVVAVLAWCHRSGLVVMPEDEGVIGALILDLGRDVAMGRARVPGVAPAATLSWLQDNLSAKSLRQSAADLCDQVSWLAAARLVTFDDAPDLVAMPTRLGGDVAAGRTEVLGVKSPSSSTIMRLASNAARDRLGG
jgi:hypothetical protein